MPKRPSPGTVIEISLPNGRFAYGRTYRDAQLAIYRETTDEPGSPPIGSRDFRFIVGAFDDVFRSPSVRVVGRDEFVDPEDGWPGPMGVRDVITGGYEIYERGRVRPSTAAEAAHLEPAAVWTMEDLVARIMHT